ncbi:hypothetical protein GGX14DRAFT_387753 [Mycena pura]|uniref:Uncharacterized protein n=1 Tax=Mycena pura TaxID=153505 RepID=A0AAD6YM75_9AGAR|nr:hypothetical protein GGX14DRAFT_387753 [Mycena pura]
MPHRTAKHNHRWGSLVFLAHVVLFLSTYFVDYANSTCKKTFPTFMSRRRALAPQLMPHDSSEHDEDDPPAPASPSDVSGTEPDQNSDDDYVPTGPTITITHPSRPRRPREPSAPTTPTAPNATPKSKRRRRAEKGKGKAVESPRLTDFAPAAIGSLVDDTSAPQDEPMGSPSSRPHTASNFPQAPALPHAPAPSSSHVPSDASNAPASAHLARAYPSTSVLSPISSFLRPPPASNSPLLPPVTLAPPPRIVLSNTGTSRVSPLFPLASTFASLAPPTISSQPSPLNPPAPTFAGPSAPPAPNPSGQVPLAFPPPTTTSTSGHAPPATAQPPTAYVPPTALPSAPAPPPVAVLLPTQALLAPPLPAVATGSSAPPFVVMTNEGLEKIISALAQPQPGRVPLSGASDSFKDRALPPTSFVQLDPQSTTFPRTLVNIMEAGCRRYFPLTLLNYRACADPSKAAKAGDRIVSLSAAGGIESRETDLDDARENEISPFDFFEGSILFPDLIRKHFRESPTVVGGPVAAAFADTFEKHYEHIRKRVDLKELFDVYVAYDVEIRKRWTAREEFNPAFFQEGIFTRLLMKSARDNS